jgi:hypothetical protein
VYRFCAPSTWSVPGGRTSSAGRIASHVVSVMSRNALDAAPARSRSAAGAMRRTEDKTMIFLRLVCALAAAGATSGARLGRQAMKSGWQTHLGPAHGNAAQLISPMPRRSPTSSHICAQTQCHNHHSVCRCAKGIGRQLASPERDTPSTARRP